jgi:hypothetical protein
MTQTERTRFVILIGLLVILVAGAVLINRFSRARIGADILGTIQNQAVATYKDADGIEQTTLSDISQVTVASGVGTLTMTYQLEGRQNQSTNLDLQLFKPDDDAPLTTVRDKKGDKGSLVTKLQNIPNGTLDFSIKPLGYLSQAKKNIAYNNGGSTTLQYETPFLWGDIDVSAGGKGDNTVNNADWSVLVNDWNKDSEKADLNGDGVVNNVDASTLLNNWTKDGDRFDTAQSVAADTNADVPQDLSQ